MPTQLCYLITCLAALASAGCCCSPCGGPLGSGVGSTCRSGPVGGGGLLGLAGCRAGCGEVYVDEWISEPPTVDNCGYDCGGCGACNQCQPVRNALRLLWGRPYVAGCDTGACDAGFGDAGFGGDGYAVDSYAGHSLHASGDCNCGQHHAAPSTMHPLPATGSPGVPLEVVPPNAPQLDAPPSGPTPAPTIAPSSARRLNPAQQRISVRSVSTQATRR